MESLGNELTCNFKLLPKNKMVSEFGRMHTVLSRQSRAIRCHRLGLGNGMRKFVKEKRILISPEPVCHLNMCVLSQNPTYIQYIFKYITYIHIYIHTYNTYIHTYLHTYIHTYMDVLMTEWLAWLTSNCR